MITGYLFAGSVDFGLGLTFHEQVGGTDVFVAKLLSLREPQITMAPPQL
jgi:hypothetical protein